MMDLAKQFEKPGDIFDFVWSLMEERELSSKDLEFIERNIDKLKSLGRSISGSKLNEILSADSEEYRVKQLEYLGKIGSLWVNGGRINTENLEHLNNRIRIIDIFTDENGKFDSLSSYKFLEKDAETTKRIVDFYDKLISNEHFKEKAVDILKNYSEKLYEEAFDIIKDQEIVFGEPVAEVLADLNRYSEKESLELLAYQKKYNLCDIDRHTLWDIKSQAEELNEFQEKGLIEEINLRKMLTSSILLNKTMLDFIIKFVNTKENLELLKYLNNLPETAIGHNIINKYHIIRLIENEADLELVKKLANDIDIKLGDIFSLLKATKRECSMEVVEKLLQLKNSNPEIYNQYAPDRYHSILDGIQTPEANKYILSLFEENSNPEFIMTQLAYAKQNSIRFNTEIQLKYSDTDLLKVIDGIQLNDYSAKFLLSLDRRVYSSNELRLIQDFTKNIINSEGYSYAQELINQGLFSNKEFTEKIEKLSGYYTIFLKYIKPDNISIVNELLSSITDRNIEINNFMKIVQAINKDNAPFAKELLFGVKYDIPINLIGDILINTRFETVEFAEQICLNNSIPKERISTILKTTNKENLELAAKIFDKNLNINIYDIIDILRSTTNINIELANKLLFDENYNVPIKYIGEIINYFRSAEEITLADHLCLDSSIPREKISVILNATNEANAKFAEKIIVDKNLNISLNEAIEIIRNTTEANIELAEKMLASESVPKKIIPRILGATTGVMRKEERDDKVKFAERLIFEEQIDIKSLVENDEANIDILVKTIQKYVRGTENTAIEFFKSGKLKTYPKILNYSTDSWENIIKRNLLNREIPFFEGYIQYLEDCVSAYAKAKNDNIVELHEKLIKDAIANKDVLKTGLDDITESEINEITMSSDAIKVIDLIGYSAVKAAFPLMIDEFASFIESTSELSSKLSKNEIELLTRAIRPKESKRYNELVQEIAKLKKQLNEIVGEENHKKIKELQNKKAKIDAKIKELKQEPNNQDENIKQQIKNLSKQSKALGAEAQSLYYKSENANQIKELMKEISTKSKEVNEMLKNEGIDPIEIVTKVRVLYSIKEICTDEEYAEIIKLIKPSSPENDIAWNETINKKIFQKLGIEYDKELSDKLELTKCKYLSKMLVSSSSFFSNMKILVNIIKSNPNLTIAEAIDSMPQNTKTRELFEKLGVDYDSFTKVNKDSYTEVKIKLSAEEAKQAAIYNLEEDLNDPLFQSLPQEIREPIFKHLEQIGVTFEKSIKEEWVGDGFSNGSTEYFRLMKNGKPVEFEDMSKIISAIREEILKNEFWTTTNSDFQIENARGTMYTHLIKLRTEDVDKAKDIKDGDTAEIEIHKTDMYNIKQAIGLGNDGQCCTALGKNFNEWSAPTYIMNKCIGAIEVTDKGSFVGNTMIYLAYVDGKPALVLDNIELKTKYQFNDKIRDAFMNYAIKLCEEIGQPDLPIFAGPNRHKLNMGIYPKETHSMNVIGDSGNQQVYLDFDASSHYIGQYETVNIDMYQIR